MKHTKGALKKAYDLDFAKTLSTQKNDTPKAASTSK